MSTWIRGAAVWSWTLGLAVLVVAAIAASTPASLGFLTFWGVRAVEGVRPGAEAVRHFDADGLRLRYLDEGSGEAVVLVHGFGSSIEHNWVRPGIVGRLTEAGYRVLALDVRGHGGSEKPHDPGRYGEEEVTDIVRLMDRAGVGRAHLVGYSRGALLAHHATDRFPERFITVTLGGYGSRGDGSGPIEALPRDVVADSLKAGSLGPIIRAVTPPAEQPSARLLAVANGLISATNDMHALAAAFRADPPPIPPARLRANPVPTLVLIGELDPLREDADAMAALMTGARVHLVPGAAHRDAPAAAGFGETLLAFLQAHEGRANERPNIVVIMADDLGFSDIGAYGGEVETPSLDALAAGGLRFTQFYNTARCVPTRASLLTGLYPHRAGLGGMTFDQGQPGYRGRLGEHTVTIAELLKEAGYRTGMVGKWHVSETRALPEAEQLEWLAHRRDDHPFSPLDQYPTARGFDDYFGNIWGVVDYFDPFSLVNGTEPVADVPDDYYHTDAISDSAVAYVDRYARDDAPFFLYVAHTAPHWPLHAPAEDIARYEDTYASGWQAIREARHRRQLELGLFEPGEAPLTPRIDPELTWEANPDTVWDARAMAVHAAMVDRLDRGVGRLVRKLEETGELENTVILFLSDNGASPERPSEFGPGFDRAGSTRDGLVVAFPVDRSLDALPGPQTVHAGIGRRWANVANTPFRFWKARVHEGGINTPLVVHWPAGLGAAPGSITEQPGHVIDVMATALELAGVGYPERWGDREVHPTDGRSLLPILRGEEREGHPALFWEHFGARAVRQGPWKLVSFEEGAAWELFDLDQDRTEMNDLAGQYPERVEAMAALWEEWARESRVLPRPGALQ